MADCIQCRYMDLKDTDKYGDAYCKLRKKYYNPYSSACGSIEYIDQSLSNREDEYENGSSSCYLTTAMCSTLGYDDNCSYLTILRNFRDTYMMNEASCYPLLVQYEVIGPIISQCLFHDQETAQIILEQYIKPAILLIQSENYEQAIQVYQRMVYYLQEKYDLQNLEVDLSEIDFHPLDNMDKHKIRTIAKNAKLLRSLPQ